MDLSQRIEKQMQGQAPNQRGFVTGPAAVSPTDEAFGIDREQFSPSKYGEYLATSNSVYSVATQRAAQLADLPIRLYRFKDRKRMTTRQVKAGRYQVMRNLTRTYHLPSRFRRNLTQANLEEVTTGGLAELLHKVNPFWTGDRLIKISEMALCVFGKAFWFLERGKSGKLPPREIWWDRPDNVRVIPSRDQYISGYILESDHDLNELPFAPGEVIWFNYPNPLDQFNPLSPIAAARVYADHENASMVANINLHKQGLQMGGAIFPHDEKVIWTPEQAKAIEADLNRRFQGVGKAHRWGVFRHKVDLQEAGITPDDAQFLDGLNWDLEAVARAYHWPLDLLGGRRTYENVDAAMVAAYVFSTLPEASFIASELTEQLLPMFPGEADLLWFDASEVHVLQEAENSKWDREKEQLAAGVMTINDWREAKGLEPYPWGDVWWAPANLLPAGETPDQGMERLWRVWASRQIESSQVFIPEGANDPPLALPSISQIADSAEQESRNDSEYLNRILPEIAGILEAAETDE